MNQKTLANYLVLLEQVYQISLLRPYSRNIGKRFLKNPKLFFNDSGILSHLLNAHDEDDFEASPYRDMLLETFVFSELRKHLSLSHKITEYSFYRTADKKEIDFILVRAGKIVAIEVKLAQSVQNRDFKQIRALQTLVPKSFHAGIVLYSGNRILPFEEGVWAVPIGVLF